MNSKIGRKDEYLYFNYKGRSSSDFNTFIINEGGDLLFANSPSFTSEFAFPKFGESSYLLGTSIENRAFQMDLFSVGVSLSTYRELLAWLQPGKEPGLLVFDYDKEFGYKVIVSEIGDGEFLVDSGPVGSERTYNVQFSISFTTVGDWAAAYAANDFKQIPYLTSNRSLDSSRLVEFFAAGPNSELMTIRNKTNLPAFLEISLIPLGNVAEILEDGHVLYSIEEVQGKRVTLFSKFGIVLDSSGDFVRTTENTGRLQVPAKGELTFEVRDAESIIIDIEVREIV